MNTPRLSAFDWTVSHGIPFRGAALAPAGKPQPLFHAGSYLTSNSINVAKSRCERVTTSVEAENPEPRDLALARQGARRQRVGGGS